MSDPFKEAGARKRREARQRIAENHTPIVLWVNTDRVKALDSVASPADIVKEYIRDEFNSPFCSIYSGHQEPRVIDVVTEFDDEVDS